MTRLKSPCLLGAEPKLGNSEVLVPRRGLPSYPLMLFKHKRQSLLKTEPREEEKGIERLEEEEGGRERKGEIVREKLQVSK